jgi:hypothetical protein
VGPALGGSDPALSTLDVEDCTPERAARGCVLSVHGFLGRSTTATVDAVP